ncbi:hypothetical protein [Paenibacillus sp. L3-i20]|uniref:hypothetical protein n=1 Tax=Paenibacillus sp. L3-i20 TaxID=2905833 RepID=UPI001EDDADB8|nr:hypothetical protein [Paenibacillus sp. L3-i20]GKU77034.1 hypothetical protein L3i20_v214310 [Paenibacillus sp. L3-i20]
MLPLAESKYVLLEMLSLSIPKTMEDLIHELNMMKVRLVIAHPERNVEVLKDLERLVV